MVFWRGWGVLGLLIPALCTLPLLAIGGSMDLRSGLLTTMAGVGLVLGGLGGFFLGRYLNEVKPQAELASALLQLRQRYEQLVASGQFSRGPQYPRPQSMAEAQQQAAQQLAEDDVALRKNLVGRHTLYFIPFQWISAVAAGLGLVCVVMGLLV